MIPDDLLIRGRAGNIDLRFDLLESFIDYLLYKNTCLQKLDELCEFCDIARSKIRKISYDLQDYYRDMEESMCGMKDINEYLVILIMLDNDIEKLFDDRFVQLIQDFASKGELSLIEAVCDGIKEIYEVYDIVCEVRPPKEKIITHEPLSYGVSDMRDCLKEAKRFFNAAYTEEGLDPGINNDFRDFYIGKILRRKFNYGKQISLFINLVNDFDVDPFPDKHIDWKYENSATNFLLKKKLLLMLAEYLLGQGITMLNPRLYYKYVERRNRYTYDSRRDEEPYTYDDYRADVGWTGDEDDYPQDWEE